MKLLSYNIRFGGRGRERLLAEVVRAVAPDLVVFQEASDPRVVEQLARATDMPYCAARPAHSIAYMSRVRVARHAWQRPPGATHSYMALELAGGGRVFGLHLSARFSKWRERRRHHEIRVLLEGIAAHRAAPHVLVGDFNTLAPGELLDVRRMPHWIRALVWLSGRDIQRDTIRHMLDEGYADGYRHLYPADKGYTFPVWDPHLRLDYVFLPTPHVARLRACRVVTTPDLVTRASDHYPLLAELDLA
ncbi:MAG TPA: endonuclease/exonuclease/phosphatase family protein [Pyrinomonadaceae bacterium]